MDMEIKGCEFCSGEAEKTVCFNDNPDFYHVGCKHLEQIAPEEENGETIEMSLYAVWDEGEEDRFWGIHVDTGFYIDNNYDLPYMVISAGFGASALYHINYCPICGRRLA